jgi:hypothetical protein
MPSIPKASTSSATEVFMPAPVCTAKRLSSGSADRNSNSSIDVQSEHSFVLFHAAQDVDAASAAFAATTEAGGMALPPSL